jgi:hypothetical protein
LVLLTIQPLFHFSLFYFDPLMIYSSLFLQHIPHFINFSKNCYFYAIVMNFKSAQMVFTFLNQP